jgi:hypothetical protein
VRRYFLGIGRVLPRAEALSMEDKWLEATFAERRILYRALKRIVDGTGSSWDAVYAGAFGRVTAAGIGYEDNFRAGKISRKKAALLYRWLRANHPRAADAVDQDIGAFYGYEPQSRSWEVFIAEHGEFGHVEVHLSPEQPPQTQSQKQITVGWEPVDAEVVLNRRFRFLLRDAVAGYVIAIQWVHGRWVLLPLSPSELGCSVGTGAQWLPPDRPDHQGGLSLSDPFVQETTELGLHRIVFLVVPDDVGKAIASKIVRGWPIADSVLDVIAAQTLSLPRSTWSLFKLNVMFIASEHVEEEHAAAGDAPNP